MGFAKSAADRVTFMDEGEAVEENESNAFFNQLRMDRAQQFLSQINANSW